VEAPAAGVTLASRWRRPRYLYLISNVINILLISLLFTAIFSSYIRHSLMKSLVCVYLDRKLEGRRAAGALPYIKER